MSAVMEPAVGRPSVRFEGDVPVDAVPERYRLGDAFVPKGRYLDVEFLKLELERVFPRTWLMACRLEELPGVGSYVEYRIGDRSVLIVRESTESIRAYHNACRHRGTRLAAGRGRVGSIICPFHGWRWNLDGSIKLQLDPEEFAPRSDDDLGLQTGALRAVGRVRLHQHGSGGARRCSTTSIRSRRSSRRSSSSTCGPGGSRGRSCRATGRRCSTASSRRTTCRARIPQLNRPDKANDNPATMRELDDLRAWSPTTVYERHAKYQSVGVKRKQKGQSGRQGPVRSVPAFGGQDPREGIANAVEYIYDELRALETERSVRAAADC